MPTITVTPNPLVQPETLIDVVATGLQKGLRVNLSIDGYAQTTNRTRVGRSGTVHFSENVTKVGTRNVSIINTSTGATLVTTTLEVKPAIVTPPPTPLTISNVVTTPTQTEGNVKWHTSALSTGKLEYGITGYTNTRQPVQTTPMYQDHDQTITGLTANTTYKFKITSSDAAGNTGIYEGTFKTLEGAVTPPPDPNRVIAPVNTTDLRAWLLANKGSLMGLVAGATYNVSGSLGFSGLSGFNLDGAGATIKFTNVSQGFNFTNCTNVKVTNVNLVGTIANGYLAGHYYYGSLEHNHALAIHGGSGFIFDNITFDHFMGDGVYFAHYGTTPATNVQMTNVGMKYIGRMGYAVVAGKDITCTKTTYFNMAYQLIDIEPEYLGNNPGTIQGAWNCKFIDGVSTGWVGNVHEGGGTYYDYAACINIGTPTAAGGTIPPVIDGITIRNLNVVDANKSIFSYLGGGQAYRKKNIIIDNVTGNNKWPWNVPILRCENSDNISVTNCRAGSVNGVMDQLVSFSNCTGITQSNNTVAN